MPGPYWTSKRGSWDVQLGIEWGAFEVSGDGSQARITGGRVWRNSSANITDSSNNLAVSGGAVVDSSGSESTSGSGKKLLRNVTGQWQTLTYGSPSSANFTASWSGVEAAGSTMTITRSIEYPARAYAAPAAPTGLAVGGSGTSRTLTWSNTDPGSSSAPYHGILVGRRVDDGTWTNISLLGVVTTFTNTGVPVNAKVDYRVAAINGTTVSSSSPSNQSAWAYAAAVYTKPAAPTMGTAGKLANGDIRLTWTDQSNWNTVFDIQDSPDGSSWSTVASPADAPGVAAESWDHSSPNTGVSHRYCVRARLADGQTSDWSATSNIVQLLAAPNPPSNLAPSGTAADPADAITLTYVHNPVDSTPQTQREVQVRINSGSWSSLGADTTASQSKTIAGGTWSAPAAVEWQVRTKGAHASWSGWSATATISLTPKPVATIVTPTGTINASRVTPQVDYYDAGGHAQSSTTVTVWRDGVLLETSVAAGSSPLPQLATVFADGAEYVLQASVMSAVGLRSATVSETVDVSYLPPQIPGAAWVWDQATGAVGISTSNPEGATGTVDTVSQELWRIVDGQATLLIDDLEPNGSVSDDTPTTTGQRYRLVAVSADGATTETEFDVPPDPAVVRWWWMSADGHVARLRYRPTRSRASSLAQDVAHYAGRAEPVVTYGEAVTRTTELGGVLILDEGTDWAAFEQVALAAEPAVVRGPDGSRFRAVITSTSATDANSRRQEVTVGLTRVGDEQAPLEPVELI